ncbi:MAG: response regulator [Sphingobacteriaceae bacterium]|jgi:DNA-binding response OmpR family regulator|nr:response regulator [Sphingobacteriaceae bacterium]
MSKRILLFEDEDDVRTSIEMILDKSGYVVKGYAAADDVFSLIDDFKPDLILMDIRLEKEDGRDICRSIRGNESTSTIPVIMVSGIPEVYNSISDAGANDIVLKPFDEATLLQRIERQLN